MRRGTCTVGGKAAAEAGAVTHGAIRCSAWLNEFAALNRFALFDALCDFVAACMLWKIAFGGLAFTG